jgi:hypothetical protein
MLLTYRINLSNKNCSKELLASVEVDFRLHIEEIYSYTCIN